MKAILSILIVLAFPQTVFACEPLVPMVILFGAPVFSLFGIIFVKMVVFAVLEKSIPWYQALFFMFLANIFSSIIGLVLGLGASSPMGFVVFLPLVFWVSIKPSRRFIEYNPWGIMKGWKASGAAALVTVFYILTFVLFSLAQEQIDRSLTVYWVLKFCYIFFALVISIGLTTLWEEWVVSLCAGQDGSFLVNVLKVNLIAFFLIMALLAAKALPERMRSETFLI
jgi:hypothetical protein